MDVQSKRLSIRLTCLNKLIISHIGIFGFACFIGYALKHTTKFTTTCNKLNMSMIIPYADEHAWKR